MLYFENDYSEGACPEVLDALIKTNSERLLAYGNDSYSESAKKKIRLAAECPDADVYFISGGTQTNKSVIDAILSKYEGVISAVSGHINQHEAGAIESAGHKVLALPAEDGKLSAETVRSYVKGFYADGSHEHMVFPGMVYISHPTEYGTLYSKEELTALSEVCREYKLPLFLDGARLGYGLVAKGATLSLPDIARLCDVFYIGGTKVGALCGEAVVFTKGNTPRHFITSIKQNGSMLAKGRILGVQFDALFTDGLYTKISRQAIEAAELLHGILEERGYRFYNGSTTNQQFVILENKKLAELLTIAHLSVWEPVDENHTLVRFATSWATTKEDVLKLAKYL